MLILGCDPGKNTDPFAVVLIEARKDGIDVLGCRYWKNVPYPQIEEEIQRIYKDNNVDILVVESNSMGEHVIDSLRRDYNLPIVSVYTGKHGLKPKPSIMDKIDMTMWMNRLIQNAGEDVEPTLRWVDSNTDYYKELKRQWSIFGEYHKNKFEAPEGEHDDLVMALMLACHFARKNVVIKFDSLIVDTVKHTPKFKINYRPATELPEGAIPISDSRQSWYIPR